MRFQSSATSTYPGRVAAYSSTTGSPVITRSDPSSSASRERPAGTVEMRSAGRVPRRTGGADRTPAASVSLTQWPPVPIGQSPPGARFVTASAGSARGSTGATGGRTAIVRSPRMVADCANVESRARQAARTSRAVTGAPSQKRASSRSVNVQRSPDASHDWASPGSTRPAQSTRISVSYSCANTNRSASFRGSGACVGSMGSASATAIVSRFAAGPGAMRQMVSDGAAPGAGKAGAGAAPGVGGPARQAAANSAASMVWR